MEEEIIDIEDTLDDLTQEVVEIQDDLAVKQDNIDRLFKDIKKLDAKYTLISSKHDGDVTMLKAVIKNEIDKTLAKISGIEKEIKDTKQTLLNRIIEIKSEQKDFATTKDVIELAENVTKELKKIEKKIKEKKTVYVGGGGGYVNNIDDNTPSTETTYSSSKVDSMFKLQLLQSRNFYVDTIVNNQVTEAHRDDTTSVVNTYNNAVGYTARIHI